MMTTLIATAVKEVICIENPIFRLVSYVFVDLDQTMEVYMTNLKTHLGN